MKINQNATNTLPIAIIGAGPIGLAAAAHLSRRGMKFFILEAGSVAGSSIQKWSHIRLFSPWRYLMDSAAKLLLEQTTWSEPELDYLPTGAEFLDTYLLPLAANSSLAPYIQYNSSVVAVGRLGFDKVKTEKRNDQPFELVMTSGKRMLARAVLDASGTWLQPNPIGSGGLFAQGEMAAQNKIHYGIPDILGKARNTYANITTMVVGSGHSAMNGLLDLLTLAKEEPATKVIWSLRKTPNKKVYGGEEADALPARGLLGKRVRQAVESNQLTVLAPFRILEVKQDSKQLAVYGSLADIKKTVKVDKIIAATGFRPDINMLREVRAELDPWLEAPIQLAPMIDPNLHSCGSVRPHGAKELSHPEKDFYILGMKSYGRAPTFLMATGYEQARSVVAMLDGDIKAANNVELNLPETGVCNVSSEFSDTNVQAEEPATACC